MEYILPFINSIAQILMQKIDTILQFTRSDQTNHANHIIKIVPCKAALLRQEKQDS